MSGPETDGRVLVAGAINTDLVGRGHRAPEAGETVTGSSFQIFGGGKGANQALTCARSGAPTAILGATGNDDFGRQRLSDLLEDNIDITWVDVTDDAPSGVALISVEEGSGQNRIHYIPGATMTVTRTAAEDAVANFRPSVVLLTNELPKETRAALVAAGRAAGTRVVVNASPEAIEARFLLSEIDVLIVNETEAADLLGEAVTNVNASEAVRALARLGPGLVALTVGSAGAILAIDGEIVQLSPPPVTVVDTTGAGDAFSGAMTAALARGENPVTAARIGVVAGSLACTKHGAQPSMPHLKDIEALLDTMG